MKLDKPAEIYLGGLGVHLLVAGWYTYAGSGLNELEGRIKRHLRPAKKMHRHID